jgi:hypothetical protein
VIEIVGDSKCAASIFLKGGSQAAYDEVGDTLPLLERLLDVLRAALEAQCEVRMRWTRRENLTAADELSKEPDHYDFGLRPARLSEALRALGWEVGALGGAEWTDRFAAPHNSACARFNCLYATSAAGAGGTEALAADWSVGSSYVLPPFELIDSVLDKIERDNAVAMVVVPRWPSKAWWWRLRGGSWQDRIVSEVELPVDSLRPHQENAEFCFFGRRFDCRMLALRTRRVTDSVRGGAASTVTVQPDPSA